jgi:hypothetical protein
MILVNGKERFILFSLIKVTEVLILEGSILLRANKETKAIRMDGLILLCLNKVKEVNLMEASFFPASSA